MEADKARIPGGEIRRVGRKVDVTSKIVHQSRRSSPRGCDRFHREKLGRQAHLTLATLIVLVTPVTPVTPWAYFKRISFFLGRLL